MFAKKGFKVLPILRRNFFTEPVKSAKKLPDPWDLATGLELFEALQHAKGNKDPFLTAPQKKKGGTKDCPIVVLSVFDKRMVGCHCHPDDTNLTFFWLHNGYPRRCNCNYWFCLQKVSIDDDEPPEEKCS